MPSPRWAKKAWWRTRRRLYEMRPPYVFRFGSDKDRFRLQFYNPSLAIRYLVTRSGRRHLRMSLAVHRQHCLSDGGYSADYFAGLDRWRRAAGDRT